MRNQGALRAGACASSTRLDSAGGAGVVVGEAKRTRALGIPNEPERSGSAGGLAFLATCANEPERAAVSERVQRVATFPNEPEVCALQTNPSRARYPNEPERGEIQSLHTTVLVGGGALNR